MDNENKKNDSPETSPIRGLFRKNEDAYDKHQREKENAPAENEDFVSYDGPVPETAPVQEKKKGIKGFFNKLAEILTQPEDFSLNAEDEDEEFEDIFSGKEPNHLDKYKEKAEDGLPKETEEPEPVNEEELYASETVLYSAVSEDEGDETVYEEKTPVTPQEKPPVTEEAKTEEKPEEKEEKTSASAKLEINLDDILKAKNTVSVGTPITINAPVKVTETVQEELSHNAKPEKPKAEAQRVNELSHEDKPSAEKVSAPKASELSHDAKTEKPKAEAPRVNELSREDKAPEAKADKNSPENKSASAAEKVDFRERTRSAPMVYHHHDSKPFVVMAGKFTKTVRTEYETIRRIRGSAPPPPPAPEPPEPPKPLKSSAPPKPAASKEQKAEKAPEIKKAEIKEKQPLTLKPKKRSVWKKLNIFSSEEDAFENEEDFIEEKPDITDYDDPSEADAIRTDINSTLSKVFARTIVLCFTSVFSIIAAVLNQLMPQLFGEWIHNGWLVYGIASFILFAVSIFVERYTIFNGISSLRHIRGNSDTAVAVVSVAAAIQAVTALFLPDIYINGTYHLYVCPAILAMLFNSFGKLLIIKRTADNFHFLTSKKAAYAGKIYTESANADSFVKGLPVQRPIIAYSKKADFMTNFLHLSHSSDPIEDNASFVAPFATLLSVITAIAYGVINHDFIGAASSFALTAFITTPICCLIALNFPLKNLCSSTLRRGAMVSGYEAVRQFSDTNAVMLDYTDLYPQRNIILSGVKAINESKMKFALEAGAAVTFAVKGPMTHIFETIIQNRRNMLPQVDSVTYDDKKGLAGWIGTQRILLGNRDLLAKHNINVPDAVISAEKKYRDMGSEVTYISISGELVAMFIMTYKVERSIADALRELTENGVNIIVRTIDHNITPDKIADNFHIFRRSVNVLQTGLGTVCYKELTSKKKNSRAYVVTNGHISALASAVVGCIKLNAGVMISIIIQMLSVIAGFFVATGISMLSGFAKLGNIEALLYTAFWCAVMIILSTIARRLTS